MQQLLEFSANDIHTHSLDYAAAGFLDFAYGWTDDITLSLRLPYIYQDDIRASGAHGGAAHFHEDGDSAGIGDILFLGSFRLFASEDDSFHLAAIAGIEIPSGRTGDRTREGELFEADHQPGSGSWDPLFGLAMSKTWDRWSLHLAGTYQFNTEGTQDSNLGDQVTYNAAIVYPLLGHEHEHHDHDHAHEHEHADAHHGHAHPAGHGHSPALDLILEINGSREGWDLLGGEIDENTGGNLVYFSPGLSLTVNEHRNYYLSVGIPIVEDRNGVQQDTDYRIIAGTSATW